mmetsp:Transcript_77690/g.186387  ORF Transcript_77690/g.186387 Transcript_77690/m.186387 type:complete len:228 (+) Transcript_77690:291-974(+)
MLGASPRTTWRCLRQAQASNGNCATVASTYKIRGASSWDISAAPKTARQSDRYLFNDDALRRSWELLPGQNASSTVAISPASSLSASRNNNARRKRCWASSGRSDGCCPSCALRSVRWLADVASSIQASSCARRVCWALSVCGHGASKNRQGPRISCSTFSATRPSSASKRLRLFQNSRRTASVPLSSLCQSSRIFWPLSAWRLRSSSCRHGSRPCGRRTCWDTSCE